MSPPFVDRRVLRDWAEYHGEGGAALAAGLIDLFLGTAPDDFERLNAAIECGDRPTVNLLSHSLKSSCTNVGAVPAATLFARIEGAGPDLAAAAVLRDDLKRLFGPTIDELRLFRNEMTTAA